jgi:hypothetical protein
MGLLSLCSLLSSIAHGQAYTPPPLDIVQAADGTAPGLIFCAQTGAVASSGGVTYCGGPEIMDNQGRAFWHLPVPTGSASDFRVQTYLGQPVLTWAQGAAFGDTTAGTTTDFVCDSTYHVIAAVQAGNGMNADLHEFELTAQGTALIVIYHQVQGDLSSVGGAASGPIIEGVVQEINLATGAVLFEWHSLDYVPLTESYQTPSANVPFDYFHINSVRVDVDGNLIVSARHTWTVYKLNRTTGAVMWRLGGKSNSFTLGPGLPTAWQHNAVAQQDGLIRIFDNESDGEPVLPASRVVWIQHDDNAMTATLVQSLQHPSGISVAAEGDAEILPNGDTLVGWGIVGGFSEFTSAGQLDFDVHQSQGYSNYRTYRFPWTGAPTTSPALTVVPGASGTLTVTASWNGATQVASWQVLGGATTAAMAALASAPWNGLSTAISVPNTPAVLQVVALASDGTQLGASAVVDGPFSAPAAPVLAEGPQSQSVAAGDSFSLNVGAAQPGVSYQWYLNGFPVVDGNWSGPVVTGAATPTLLVTGAAPIVAGTYTCKASNPAGLTTSTPAVVTLASSTTAGRLINLSVQSWVGTGANVLDLGFVVGGAQSGGTEPLLVRASGPALAQFNVEGRLPDPLLQLLNADAGNALLASDAGWQGSVSISSTAAAVGAFAWTDPSSLDSALVESLAPGLYVAQISGDSGDTGQALGEVYDATPSADYAAASPRLINASSRATVGGQSGSILTLGFVVGGTASRTLLIRASGPALAEFDVPGTLADPQLQLFATGGASPYLLATDAGWAGNPTIAAAATDVGAFAWSNPASADSALLVTLPPGNYTVQISSASGANAGITLGELYEVR